MGLGGLLGGSKQKVPATGFYAQPKAYQDLYNTILGNANSTIGSVNADMFTPMALTSGEQNALTQLGQGFTPTEQSLRSDISMLMNPYDEYVINDINRQAQGQNSLVNQFGSRAGQQGSNRNFLATSDVEQNRLNNVGQFRQSQYNTAIDQILNGLVPGRRADAMGALTAGTYERGLDAQANQAPLTVLTAQQGALAGIPTSFGNFGTPEQTIKTGGGLGGLMGGIGNIGSILQGGGMLSSALGAGSLGSALGTAGTIASFFSDDRLKQDVEFVGLENGHKIYEFCYKSDPSKRFVGVMASEVEEISPNAVHEVDGWKTVDYNQIGVRFREVV